ncbi:GNL3L/Grn1 GTPase [Toxoplasma gondii MAS]|nr:GNL3L/Grn1 GTPase [Toxoplasma gondii MAS]
MKSEKVAFWKLPEAAGGTGENRAVSPAEVYASVLASQCRAIEIGEDEAMADSSNGRETGVVRVGVDLKQSQKERQRPHMLLRFAPVPRSATSPARTEPPAASAGAASGEVSRHAGEGRKEADAAVSKKERMPHVVAMAKNKQAAKKKRKLANRLQRLAGEMQGAPADEEASMDEM